jgi:hypothetical protein
LCRRAVFCEAYKKKVYGERFQWLIVGMYEANWWDRDQTNLDCSPAEVGIGTGLTQTVHQLR